MKKILTLLLVLITFTSIFAIGGNQGGFGKSNQDHMNNQGFEEDKHNHEEILANYELQELSQEEIEGLYLMREEEKLARDVYYKLYSIWGQRTFSNIADSENQHMSMVGILIERYNLTDPIQEDIKGEFKNEELQTLYNNLIEKGSKSLLDALIVGATVEDLDIKDLEELLAQTDNKDITMIYENLQKGSRNHIRTFVAKIEQNGGNYSAQYISQEELEEILATSKETGRLNENKEFIEQENSQNLEEIKEEKGNENKMNQERNFFTKIWDKFVNWFN